MNAEQFQDALRQEGYTEFVRVDREANGGLDRHSHPFESKALVLSGEIRIAVAEGERTYRPGDIFHLQHAQDHVEHYGPQGVSYLVGRK